MLLLAYGDPAEINQSIVLTSRGGSDCFECAINKNYWLNDTSDCFLTNITNSWTNVSQCIAGKSLASTLNTYKSGRDKSHDTFFYSLLETENVIRVVNSDTKNSMNATLDCVSPDYLHVYG